MSSESESTPPPKVESEDDKPTSEQRSTVVSERHVDSETHHTIRTAPRKRKTSGTTNVRARKSPKTSKGAFNENPSGKATGDPAMVLELVGMLLDGCTAAQRNEMAEKHGIDKQKLHKVK
jgi:hypothetical protein